jgi:hypothetical protein
MNENSLREKINDLMHDVALNALPEDPDQLPMLAMVAPNTLERLDGRLTALNAELADTRVEAFFMVEDAPGVQRWRLGIALLSTPRDEDDEPTDALPRWFTHFAHVVLESRTDGYLTLKHRYIPSCWSPRPLVEALGPGLRLTKRLTLEGPATMSRALGRG